MDEAIMSSPLPLSFNPSLCVSHKEIRHRALRLGLGLWLLLLAFLPPGIYSLDGNSMLAVSESVVQHHAITVPQGLGVAGRDGRIYSRWYPLLSVLAIPFVYAASIVSHLSGLPLHYVAAVFALILPGALTAATASLVALLSIRIGATWRRAWVAALCYALGTIALAYARTFFADPLLAFLAVFALYLTIGRSPKEIFGAACLATLAVLAKPTGVIIGPTLSAYLLAKRVPWRWTVLPWAGTVAGFALYTVYNEIRFGSFLNFGPSWSLFRLSAIPGGVAGLLASPGWGLIWYCPVILVVFLGAKRAWREYAWEVLLITAIFLGFLLLHSYFVDWSGGWAWGPRYLLPGLPGLCALLSRIQGNGRKAVACLALAGFLVNAPTSFAYYERYYSELTDRGVPLKTVTWSFRLAPFIEGWPAAIREVQDALRVNVREIFLQRGIPSKTVADSRALRVVAIWWWVLPLARVPRTAGVAASMVLLILGCFMIFIVGRDPWQEGAT
jgi:hypothetical protein